MDHRVSSLARTVMNGLKVRIHSSNIAVNRAYARQRKPMLIVQPVLPITTPPASRKNESKRVQQNQLLFLVQIIWEVRQQKI